MFHQAGVGHWVSGLAILCLTSLAGPAAAQSDGRLYAFLVGVQDYTTLKPLTASRADVTDLARLLREAGVPRNRITLFHEKQPERFRPEAKKIR